MLELVYSNAARLSHDTVVHPFGALFCVFCHKSPLLIETTSKKLHHAVEGVSLKGQAIKINIEERVEHSLLVFLVLGANLLKPSVYACFFVTSSST